MVLRGRSLDSSPTLVELKCNAPLGPTGSARHESRTVQDPPRHAGGFGNVSGTVPAQNERG